MQMNVDLIGKIDYVLHIYIKIMYCLPYYDLAHTSFILIYINLKLYYTPKIII
jgi:hypothetical protein